MSKILALPLHIRQKITPIMVVPLIGISILFAILMYFNNFQTCTASDLHPTSPSERTFSSFTKQSACTKALAICTYYSRDPKKCKVIN